MAESGTESALVTWNVPQCPFAIEYSPRVVDDIRLAVTDAFFSLPRGGAEIGGILLGTFDGTRLAILDYAPLECEHAFGPSFQVSLNDEVRLRELLFGVPENYPGLETVGWYHSHTRSGIFISDIDLEVHKLFFPEPWQVALVMKPHTFEPTRIGFFFREPDGGMHTSASYKEVEVTAQPMRQVPAGPPAEASRPSNSRQERARRIAAQVELEATAEAMAAEPVAPAAPPPAPVPAPVPASVPAPVPVSMQAAKAPERPVARAVKEEEPAEEPEVEAEVEPPVPQFLTQQAPPSSGRRWMIALVSALVILGVIGAAVKTHEAWVPKFVAAVGPSPASVPAPPPSLGLRAADHDGQLEITWDRLSMPVRQASDGILEISDGGPLPQTIRLDAAHLEAGTFTYGRQGEKVDVKLIVRVPDGAEVRQVTSFLGKLPDRKPPEESEESRKQREATAAQAAKMKTDLNWQVVKTKRLEKDLQTVREELRQQQKKRLLNQAGEKE